MKIALINNLYPPEETGGTEKVVQKMAETLLKERHEVIVITGSKHEKCDYYKNYKVVRFKPFNIYFLTESYKYPLLVRLVWHKINMFNLISYIQLKRILKRERVNLIISHNLTGLGFLLPSLFKAMNIKYIQYLHDIQLVIPSGILIKGEENKFINSGWPQKIYEKIIKSLFLPPDEVISPSKWLMNFYLERGFFKKPKHTINGINWEEFNLEAIKSKLLNLQVKIRAGSQVNYLYVGKIEEHKGILWLVKNWQKIGDNHNLTIVGGGTKKSDLLKIIADIDNIKYLGKKDKNDLAAEYLKADALIMPTLCYENRPEVILEAYANNLPVIASNLGGIPEITREGETGHLFEAGDFKSLKKATLL